MAHDKRMNDAINDYNRAVVGDPLAGSPVDDEALLARMATGTACWRRHIRERAAQFRGEPAPPVPLTDLTRGPHPDLARRPPRPADPSSR